VHAVQAPLSTGEVTFSSWEAAPEALPRDALPGLADALDGATVGTRVVSLVSAEDNDGESLVLVLDVLGAF
jgi:peptidylprolyl isomerase